MKQQQEGEHQGNFRRDLVTGPGRNGYRESYGRKSDCLGIRRLGIPFSFTAVKWGKDAAWLNMQVWCGGPRETM